MAEERDRHGISNNFNQDFPLSTYKTIYKIKISIIIKQSEERERDPRIEFGCVVQSWNLENCMVWKKCLAVVLHFLIFQKELKS